MAREAWLRPACWEKARWEEELDWPQRTITHLQIGEHIRPLDLYAYLRSRFGVPNGLTMKHRAPDSDNPIQWQYTIKAEDSLLRFFGTNVRTELFVHGPRSATPEDAQRIAAELKQDFPEISETLGEVKRGFESWQMAVNPYYRLDMLLERLAGKLGDLKLTPPQRLPPFPEPAQVEKYIESFESWREDALEAFHLSSSASIFAPILAESFVNLALFALAIPEFRRDEEAFEKILRSPIHERVLNLHDHCVGFQEPVDGEDPEIKAFLQATNRRNTLLHGNVDLRELVFGEVAFDLRTIPLFKDDETLSIRLVEHLAELADPSTALEEIQTAREFVDSILGFLDEPSRQFIERVMSDSHIGWRGETTTVGSLFGPMITEQHFLSDGTARTVRLSRFLSQDLPETWQLMRHTRPEGQGDS